MLRRLLALLLALWLPLANASVAVMGISGSGCDAAPQAQASAAHDCASHQGLHAGHAHGAVDDGTAHATHCPDHGPSDGSPGHGGCAHCDFCLSALGAPPAATSSDRGCALADRLVTLASELESAFLETPRRPPSR